MHLRRYAFLKKEIVLTRDESDGVDFNQAFGRRETRHLRHCRRRTNAREAFAPNFTYRSCVVHVPDEGIRTENFVKSTPAASTAAVRFSRPLTGLLLHISKVNDGTVELARCHSRNEDKPPVVIDGDAPRIATRRRSQSHTFNPSLRHHFAFSMLERSLSLHNPGCFLLRLLSQRVLPSPTRYERPSLQAAHCPAKVRLSPSKDCPPSPHEHALQVKKIEPPWETPAVPLRTPPTERP